MTPGAGKRWFRFQAVGAAGTCVQLVSLSLLRDGLGMSIAAATAAAVEIAVLHTFCWHRHWTWALPGGPVARRKPVLLQFFEYNLTCCMLSLPANVLLTGMYMRILPVHYLIANLMAIGTVGVANFLMGEFWIFSSMVREEKERES